MNEISKKSINFYKENGYLIVKNLISKKDIVKINSRLLILEKNQNKTGRGLSEPGIKKSLIHSLHKDRELKKIIFEKEWYKNICKKLLNSKNPITWNCKSNLKKKWHGSAEYYHQDYEYWRTYGFSNPNMLSCMIFIDNHSHLNGGMWIFPKSHNKHYKHEKFLNINSLQKNLIPSKTLNKLSKKNKPIKISEKAGSCIFFHCKLVHGSSHNISDLDRKIVLSQVADFNSYKKVNVKKIDSQNSKKRQIYEKKVLKERLNKIS